MTEGITVLDKIRHEMVRLCRESRKEPALTVYINPEAFAQLKYELDGMAASLTQNCTDCDFMINGHKGYLVSMSHPPLMVVAA